MGRTSLRPWFMGNKMQFEAVACRLFLHYSYTLAQKASNYGIFCFYNSFCLDEEDINPLQNFVAQIKSADSDSVIYVSTYGYEITNSKGEKSTYADALWIDTVLPISQIERYIEKSGVAEPSNISFVGDSDECGNYKVWIIAQEENNPHIIELTDRKKIDHMIILYWD